MYRLEMSQLIDTDDDKLGDADEFLCSRRYFTMEAWDSAKKVELSDVVPDYYDFDEADIGGRVGGP